jgi:hypothetical protein
MLLGETLYHAHERALEVLKFQFYNAFPWLAENREMSVMHVAIAKNGIVLAKETRPSLRRGSSSNKASEIRIMVRCNSCHENCKMLHSLLTTCTFLFFHDFLFLVYS